MPNFHWSVIDANTGHGISGAFISVSVGTNPCPKDFFGGTGTCTSGPGYVIQSYTDSTGSTPPVNIKYSCHQDLSGTVSANGYAARDFTDSTGNITGDIWYVVKLSPNTAAASAGLIPGQGTQAAVLNAQPGVQASTAGSDLWNSLTGEVNTLGWIAAVIVIAIAIILIAVVVLTRT